MEKNRGHEVVVVLLLMLTVSNKVGTLTVSPVVVSLEVEGELDGVGDAFVVAVEDASSSTGAATVEPDIIKTRRTSDKIVNLVLKE